MFDSLVDSFSLLESLDEADREQVRWVVSTLTDGMEMDLRSFPAEDSGGLEALARGADLDRYTYLVAGCVGEFWTKITTAHEGSMKGWDVAAMSDTGVRFGKALQLTNVIRDLREDARNGRVYVPREMMEEHGVTRDDLANGTNPHRVRKLIHALIRLAKAAYDEAERHRPTSAAARLLTSEAMRRVYYALLLKIEKNPQAVLYGRVSLHPIRKAGEVISALASTY